MQILYIPSDYLLWHYTESYGYILSFWKKILWILHRTFSTKIMLKTLLLPWRKLGSDYPERFDLSEYLSDFIINIMMRIVGFTIRSIFIIITIILSFLILLFMAMSFLVWTILPVFLIALFIYGLKIL